MGREKTAWEFSLHFILSTFFTQLFIQQILIKHYVLGLHLHLYIHIYYICKDVFQNRNLWVLMELIFYKHWSFQTELEIFYWMPINYGIKEIHQLKPSNTFLTHFLCGFWPSPVVEILLFMTSIIDSLDSPLSSLDITPAHWFLFKNCLNPSCSLNVNVFPSYINHPLFFTKTPRDMLLSFPPLTWNFYLQFRASSRAPKTFPPTAALLSSDRPHACPCAPRLSVS